MTRRTQPLSLDRLVIKFLADEEFYPELDIPIETVKEVMFTFSSYVHDMEMREEAENVSPEAAKQLYPTRIEKYQAKVKKLLRLPE